MELRTLLIGGIIPSILLGSGTVLMKMSLRSGIGLPVYLMIVGGTVLIYGSAAAALTSFQRQSQNSKASTLSP